MIKKIIKLTITSLFLAISIFLILFSLNKIGIISLDFSFLNGIPGWNNVNTLENKHPIPFNSLVFGVSILFAYISLNIVLSMIPILGKAAKIVIKIIIGWLILLSSIGLIIFGVIGIIGWIPGL